MAIYSKPTHQLMKDMVAEMGLHQGRAFTKYQVLSWFEEHYPKIKKSTVTAHLTRLTTNMASRAHYAPKHGDDDIFFQEASGHFRLYDSETDPSPIYHAKTQTKDEEKNSAFSNDDPSDMGGAPAIAPSTDDSAEFSLMTITRNGVSMTFEQFGQKVADKQAAKQNNLDTVATVNGWKLEPDFTFEPWSIFLVDGTSDVDKGKIRCVRADEAAWNEPLEWARDAESALQAHRQHPDLIAEITRPRVWCGQRNDPLAPEVPEEWRIEFFNLIRRTPMLDWLLVTKHPGKMRGYFTKGRNGSWEPPAPNIWLGVRVEDQKAADQLVPALLDIGVAKRFIHCEPLLGPVDLRDWLGEACRFCGGSGIHCISCGYSGFRTPSVWRRENLQSAPVSIDWVVVGGERGWHAKRMHPGWARSLRDQCCRPNVPFFFRNSGSRLLAEWVSYSEDDTALGGIPEDLRVRQYPHSPHACE